MRTDAAAAGVAAPRLMSGDMRQNCFSHKYGFESTRIADTVFMATGLQLLLPVWCDSSTCRLPVSLTTFRHTAASGAPLRSLALVRRPRHLSRDVAFGASDWLQGARPGKCPLWEGAPCADRCYAGDSSTAHHSEVDGRPVVLEAMQWIGSCGSAEYV